jgi:hypothetical protein
LIEIGLLVLEKIFFFNIDIDGFPYCGPSQPPGAMLLTNLNLHYTWIRKLSSKYELFWLSGS